MALVPVVIRFVIIAFMFALFGAFVMAVSIFTCLPQGDAIEIGGSIGLFFHGLNNLGYLHYAGVLLVVFFFTWLLWPRESQDGTPVRLVLLSS